ncbi:hypothetical protein SDRG_12235 [Saprolegnia diclina VS20]|uniref:Uncharacterized protein n=1 Tax=Saprolegnia diclina (strain VS20) TaxID=1156394 RepID=T0RCN6_SAPDV|nr:hypothetical protein SDRG_12235 [Saprolegnia diclina VS20]EQC29953.1 hypothetical protein SDRG_12235 [Saprolegnia diclina VS20]|eukprot:XP_008616520.1 hypothetical protein SDRG_12235 [Saprolegnia diclina VS20]
MTTIVPRATSPSLPSVVLHAILEATAHGTDVVALLNALPVATLSPELAALRDLGAVVDLAKHLSYTVLGREGVVALARALPAWMARGLKTLQLSGTGLNDKDALVLAVALVPNRNQRPLTIDLTANGRLTIASAPVLLTTLSACYDVTLLLN